MISFLQIKIDRQHVDCPPRLQSSGECLSTTLVIGRPSRQDAGLYTCVVKGAGHELRFKFKLTIDVSQLLLDPEERTPERFPERKRNIGRILVEFRQNATECAGNSFLFKCTGQPRDEVQVKIVKLGDDHNLARGKMGDGAVLLPVQASNSTERTPDMQRLPEHGSDSLYKTTVTYRIDELKMSDGGQYLCAVGHDEFVYSTMTLDVQQCNSKFCEQIAPKQANTAA